MESVWTPTEATSKSVLIKVGETVKSIAVRQGQDKLIGQVSERHTQSHVALRCLYTLNWILFHFTLAFTTFPETRPL